MSIQPVRYLVAALLVGILGFACETGLSCLRAERSIARMLSADSGLRLGAVHVDVFDGRVVIEDVHARIGDADVSIGRLGLPAASASTGFVTPVSADPAAAPAPAAGTIQADNVVVTRGTTMLHIPRLEMAGTSLSKADLTELLDGKSSDSVEVRLRKISAAAVVIPEIAIDDTTAGSERHGTLRQVLLANVVAGKAAALSASDSSLAVTDGDEVINEASGSIEAANVDLAQLAHVAEATRTDPAEPILPLFDKAVVNAVKLANVTRDASISAASLAATGVQARALAKGMASAGATVSHAAPMSATRNPASTALLDDLGQSVVVGTLDVDDLASRDKAADGDTSFTAAHLGLKALGEAKIGAMDVREFHLAGPTAKLGIGLATATRLTMPRLASTGVAETPARPGQVDLKQVDVEVTARDKASRAQAAQIKFTIEHFAAEQAGGSTSIPATGAAKIDNLGFDVTPGGSLTHSLYDMGYRHVSLSCAFGSAYDAAAQELSVHPLALAEPAMGSIDVALLLANVTQGLLSTNPQVQQASALALLARSVDIKVINKGLFDKALALKAQQDGMTVADERQFGVDFFANKLPAILGDGANARTIGAAVAKFIADPKSLDVSLKSKQGLGIGVLGMLGDPGAVLDSLDVHASADE